MVISLGTRGLMCGGPGEAQAHVHKAHDVPIDPHLRRPVARGPIAGLCLTYVQSPKGHKFLDKASFSFFSFFFFLPYLLHIGLPSGITNHRLYGVRIFGEEAKIRS